MAITLRTNKGTALTYQEMDVNFSSFFYSASLSTDLSTLSLFYTGSALQAPSSLNIPLNPYTGSAPQVAGSVNELQFKSSNTQFGGAGELVYDSAKGGLAINTASLDTGDRLRVYDGNVVVDGGELHIASGVYSSSLAYGGTSFDLTLKNLYEDNDADIIIWTGGSESFRIKGDGSFSTRGAGNNYPLDDNVISGSIVFGKTLEDTYRSKLFSWDSSDSRIENNLGNNLIQGQTRGVMLEGPHSGHVMIGVQSGGNEGFHIISGPVTSSVSASYDRLVASFHSDGNVGIGTAFKAPGYQFLVSGSISGSAGLNIAGNTVVTGSITSNANLYVNGNSTLSGSVTINTLPTASSSTNYDFLVGQSGQIVRQVVASPIPQGGIIMWSGTMASLPSGWNLCDGGTYNSIVTPDLRNKFIVGSGDTYNTGSTGGNTSHDHGAATGNTALTTAQMPSHDHGYKDSYYIEINNPGVGPSGAIDGVDYVGPTAYKGSGDSDNDNKYVYYRNGTTNTTGSGANHNHSISSENHLPPYYALAFIMYTG